MVVTNKWPINKSSKLDYPNNFGSTCGPLNLWQVFHHTKRPNKLVYTLIIIIKKKLVYSLYINL